MNNQPVSFNIPVVGFIAQLSGVGKTTLITRLLPIFLEKNIRVAVVKHTHHDFTVDQPGKDSYEMRKAGAKQTIIASPYRIASIQEFPDTKQEPDLATCLARIDTSNIDLVIVEGFKHAVYPKIEVYREPHSTRFLYTDDKNIIALVSNIATSSKCTLAQMDIDNPSQVANFLITTFKLNRRYE